MRVIGPLFCATLMLAFALPASPARADALTLQQLSDRAEIAELVARYVTALDTRDADAYAGVFTEDGVYDVVGTVHKGHAAIRKIVTDLQAGRARTEAEGKRPVELYHVMANSSIELVDDTHARHQCYAQTVRAGEDGRFVVGFMGRYEDELVKRDGRWLIQSRKLVSFVPPAP